MRIGNKEFDFQNEAYIMGILNATPDSFSDGGQYNNIDAALIRTEKMIEEGASIIDVGGESTRPGYTKISDSEEIERVAPIIQAIKARFDVPVSVDTYKSRVASAAVDAGADLINDIWGFKYDEKIAEVTAKAGVACCLMHNKEEAVYNNYVEDVLTELSQCIEIALHHGVDKNKIILDPGVGFGKTYENNLEIIDKCDRIANMGYPVLLGTSRKSVIGLTLNNVAAERVVGTTATTVIGYERGCRIFRVHDVKENMEALKMAKAICEGYR
ncbi:MAG: dihydropteroate synthase [Lachnospiraceae bacterium]|nr:dihydropteroate synthase [Lachnospiraceae bacterium]